MGSTPPGSKRIFISDIHLGQKSNLSPEHPYPYGWLQKHIPWLVSFLDEQLQAQDVGEVVILGDLFDRWVIPTDLEHLPDLKDICDDDANHGIIDNLQRLAGNHRLSYVPGNHDMGYCAEDMAAVKAFIEEKFQGINFICEPDRPIGVYRDGDLVAEHGNRYCLFNAPDVWTNPGKSFLPLGYFISRLVAYKVAKTNDPENYWDILCKFIDESKQNPNFIYDIFLATAKDAELDENELIHMGNIGGLESWIAIGEVANRYKSLKQHWDEVDHEIGSDMAMLGDSPLGLFDAAYKVYLGPGTDPNIKIAIFGHTHTWKNEPVDLIDENDQENDPSQDLCKAIYANSGTWVDSAHACTYVETQADEESQRHYVRVKSYPGNDVLEELFVSLAGS